MTTTLDQARRMLEVTDRARNTHQLRHVERGKAGRVVDGVELPDADAFYVVRKRIAPTSTGEGTKRAAPQWMVVFADPTQQAAVDWIDGDLPDVVDEGEDE